MKYIESQRLIKEKRQRNEAFYNGVRIVPEIMGKNDETDTAKTIKTEQEGASEEFKPRFHESGCANSKVDLNRNDKLCHKLNLAVKSEAVTPRPDRDTIDSWLMGDDGLGKSDNNHDRKAAKEEEKDTKEVVTTEEKEEDTKNVVPKEEKEEDTRNVVPKEEKEDDTKNVVPKEEVVVGDESEISRGAVGGDSAAAVKCEDGPGRMEAAFARRLREVGSMDDAGAAEAAGKMMAAWADAGESYQTLRSRYDEHRAGMMTESHGWWSR